MCLSRLKCTILSTSSVACQITANSTRHPQSLASQDHQTLQCRVARAQCRPTQAQPSASRLSALAAICIQSLAPRGKNGLHPSLEELPAKTKNVSSPVC